MSSLRVVTSALAAAAAASASVALGRPMHADLEPHYHRYLEERADVSVELDAWLNKFQEGAAANGWMPVIESRSADEQKEDQLQRFFLTKEKIKALELENPGATFSTDSPFTLLTDDEFHAYVGNAYRKAEEAARKLRGAHGSPYGDNRDGGNQHGNRNGWNRSGGSGGQQRQGRNRGANSKSNNGGSGWRANTNGNSGYNGWESSTTASDSDSETWGAVVPSKWLDWWNQITSSHSNNNNYRPETVAPYNPDTPATSAPTTPEPVTSVPEEDTPEPANADADDDNNNSGPVVAPEETPSPATNEDNTLTQAPNSGYDFDTATSAPVAAEADNSNAVSANSVDWTKSKCVSPIQNQGQCGSCWAFASIAAVESAQCIANGQQSLTKYSEQQLASCDAKNYGCNGGAPVYAFEYIKNQGVCSGEAFPYTSTSGRNAACSANCQKMDTGIKGHAKVGANEGELLSTLRTHPVVVAVAAGNNAWKQYQGGVLSACDTTQVDHAVLAVGFDGNTIKIRNSWGERWGEAGYIRLSRGTPGMGTCGVFTDMSHPLV